MREEFLIYILVFKQLVIIYWICIYLKFSWVFHISYLLFQLLCPCSSSVVCPSLPPNPLHSLWMGSLSLITLNCSSLLEIFPPTNFPIKIVSSKVFLSVYVILAAPRSKVFFYRRNIKDLISIFTKLNNLFNLFNSTKKTLIYSFHYCLLGTLFTN